MTILRWGLVIASAVILLPWVICVDLPRYVLNGPSGPDPDWLK